MVVFMLRTRRLSEIVSRIGDYGWTMSDVKTHRATKRRTSLKGLLLLSSALALSPAATGEAALIKCMRITRAKIEKKLGRPIKCRNDTRNVECFGPELEPTKVLFNESGVATRIEIRTFCNGLRGLKNKLNLIVPEKARGKLLQRTETSERGSCESGYEEEYECLKIEYRQQNCMGCVPATITVEWK